MKARIVEHTQAIDRTRKDGEQRIILARGAIVQSEGKDEIDAGTKASDKAKAADSDPSKNVYVLPPEVIFRLCDAGKAKPVTQKDLRAWKTRGKPSELAEDEAAA